uniref:BAR domain-containing protein n=1 Tax=Heterorhabditis bacteriophora TaxID=37862 RepID=A0A1I7X537_HETBA
MDGFAEANLMLSSALEQLDDIITNEKKYIKQMCTFSPLM